jgi:putative DNA primase/helicase
MIQAADASTIREFIQVILAGDIHLASIAPDGPLRGLNFGADVEAAAAWALEQGAENRNIYWTVNVCASGAIRKPTKSEITAARFAHVDIDPPKDGSPLDKVKVKAALESSRLPPSVLINSGNGLQALWTLDHPERDLDRVEGLNKALARHWGGDNCHNIDRLLRLPGTINWPNQRKRERGCVPVRALLASHHPERRYTLDELEAEFGPLTGSTAKAPRVAIEIPGDFKLLKSADLSRGDAAKLVTMIDQPEKNFRGSDRSAWAYGIACQMVDDGYVDTEVLGVLLNPANAGCAHIGDQADCKRAATRVLMRARKRYLPTGDSIFAQNNASRRNRPKITILGGNLPDIVDQAEQALIGADLGYYQAAGRIVRPCETPRVGARRGSRVRLHEVGDAELGEAFTSGANWVKPAKDGEVRVNCPAVVSETYSARVGKWRLPSLAGVIDVPTLRPDGSILDRDGYDVETGLLLVPSGTEVPKIPVSPTRDDALDALAMLSKPLGDFPFVTDADRSVALSAVLTSVSRTALANAPLHGFSAPTAGSGKSTLVDITAVMRTGHEAAPIAQGKTAEEFEKRLGALLLEGEGVVAIDNCETPLGGEFLCQLLTQPSLKVRPLGRSVMVEVPTTAMVTATGNNLTFIGDMSRRALLCQLDPGVERPELREFPFDPVKVVVQQRGEFVAAALTILRAYHVAGRPFQVPPMGSFADWSNWVRSALIWLGCADPCETMKGVRSSDPKMALIKQVMAAWDDAIGSNPATTVELSSMAEKMDVASLGQGHRQHPELRDALLAVAGEGLRINGRKLGRWLAQQRDRIVDSRKFVSPSTRGGQQVWVLETVTAAPSGEAAGG